MTCPTAYGSDIVLDEFQTEITNNFKEMKQIEEWTGMKIGNIIFDSDVDNWRSNTSVFGQKIIKKSNLAFFIEDADDNLFGGYVNTVIDEYNEFIRDPKSFIFSLKSNGRLNGMTKFESLGPTPIFSVFKTAVHCLFSFGFEICVFKSKKEKHSCCVQKSFEYNGIENALCGKTFPDVFNPRRITVVQLI